MEHKTKRNGNIELLRFVFAMGIVLLHCSDNLFTYKGGYLGVEFFFMLTGLYLVKSMNYELIDNHDLSLSIVCSMKSLFKKIIFFYPCFVVSTIIGTFVYAIANDSFFYCFSRFPFDLIFSQCLFKNAPFLSATGIVWFLSASYISLFYIYTLLYYKKSIVVKYIFPIIIISFTILLLVTCHNFDAPNTFITFFLSSGVLRAFISICLGVIISEISEKIKKKDLRKYKKHFAALETLLYLSIFLYMKFFSKLLFDVVIVALIAIALVITTSEISWFSGKFNNKYTYFLGKFSSVLFMNHFYLVSEQKKIVSALGLTYKKLPAKIAFIALSFIITYIVMLIGNSAVRYLKCQLKNKN